MKNPHVSFLFCWESKRGVKINKVIQMGQNQNPTNFHISCIHLHFLGKQTQQRRKKEKGRTWVGLMAVSRAERQWSKEPRIEITLSIMVWLFWSDSLIMAALSLGESEAITGTPMLGLPLCLIRGMTAQREREGEKEKKRKKQLLKI